MELAAVAYQWDPRSRVDSVNFDPAPAENDVENVFKEIHLLITQTYFQVKHIKNAFSLRENVLHNSTPSLNSSCGPHVTDIKV